MTIEQAILERIRRLPPANQEEVLRFADELHERPVARMGASHDRTQDMESLRQNREKFSDQWVVLEGDRLVAAGVDAHRVFVTAKAAGIAVPFLVHVIPEDQEPFFCGVDLRMPRLSNL